MSAWNLPSRSATFLTDEGANVTFSQFVFEVFHQAPGVNCQEINNPVCKNPITCQQGMSGAGYLIINSMVWLNTVGKQPTLGLCNNRLPNQIFSDQINAFDAAYTAMSGQMLPLASTFAPQSNMGKDLATLETVLGVFETVLGILSAGAFSSGNQSHLI
jgi:hypothetical protein